MTGLARLQLVEELRDVDPESAQIAGDGGTGFRKLVLDLHLKFVAF